MRFVKSIAVICADIPTAKQATAALGYSKIHILMVFDLGLVIHHWGVLPNLLNAVLRVVGFIAWVDLLCTHSKIQYLGGL